MGCHDAPWHPQAAVSGGAVRRRWVSKHSSTSDRLLDCVPGQQQSGEDNGGATLATAGGEGRVGRAATIGDEKARGIVVEAWQPGVPSRGLSPDTALDEAAGTTHALTVQGPQQALAMLEGLKLVENRGWRIPPGWYALHVGATRDSEWGRKAALAHPELPSEDTLRYFHGCIVGLLFISEQRSVKDCAGHQWASGPICHVVSRAVKLPVPVRIRGAPSLWRLPALERHRVVAQLQPGSAVVVCHETSALGPSPLASEIPRGRCGERAPPPGGSFQQSACGGAGGVSAAGAGRQGRVERAEGAERAGRGAFTFDDVARKERSRNTT